MNYSSQNQNNLNGRNNPHGKLTSERERESIDTYTSSEKSRLRRLMTPLAKTREDTTVKMVAMAIKYLDPRSTRFRN